MKYQRGNRHRFVLTLDIDYYTVEEFEHKQSNIKNRCLKKCARFMETAKYTWETLKTPNRSEHKPINHHSRMG